MSSRTDITPLSITNGKISNQAKIDPRKLAPAKEGQVLIAGKDGKFLAGDLPTTTVTNTVTTKEEVLPPNQIKIGPNTAEPGATNQFVNVGAGEHSIPRRDSSGKLKAETADQATNADKLDNQDGSYYTNVDNHVYPTPTTTTSNGNSTTTTSSAPKVIEFVPNTSNYPCSFSHTFGYIPDVTVFKNNSGTYEMIDAEVTATSSNVEVNVSDPSISTRIVVK